ncbi:hypothetical protein [Silvanigrella sp.]|jgi:hypothetical protein|uniref:hypothetical protein n=1 Tax=Silvanigrella sp. TaxID=2024976 RepID=UPI0037CA859D
MSLTLIYIFLALVLFIVSFYYLFNLWNPDISRFFSNEKIKTFLFDRFWFYENKKRLKQKNLFIILSNNSNEYLQELSEQIESSDIYKYFEESKKSFEIININSINYLFFNDFLLKESKEINLIRLKLTLRKILKLRKNSILDGVIFFPNQLSFTKKNINYKELSEEAFILSKLYKEICNKLKAKIPLFFIDTSITNNVPPLHLYPLIKDESDSSNVFGLSHRTHENTEELNKEIKKAIESCIASYELNCQHFLLNFEGNSQGDIIRFFFSLKSSLISFSKNYVDYFYKGFSLKEKEFTYSHYIINISSFYKRDEFEDKDSHLFNLFNYISKNLINGSHASKEFIRNKILNRYILAAFTLLNITFVSYALFSSTSFLQQKRSIFLSSFSELTNFINGYNKLDKSANNNDLMQNKICSLINNSNKLAATNFYYSLLYPSWNSEIEKKYSSLYNEKLGNFVSKILIQNFNDKVSEHLIKNKSWNLTNESADEIIKNLGLFVKDNTQINSIYSLIYSKNPQKDTEALTQMAYFLYGLDCGKTLAERNVFSVLDNRNIISLVNPNYIDFEQQTKDILKNSLQIYFDYYTSHHEIMIAAKKVNDNLQLIRDSLNDQDKLSDPKFVQGFIDNLNQLNDALVKNQESLKNTNSFFGENFGLFLNKVEKNLILGKEFSNKTIIVGNQKFEDFKSNLSSLLPIGASFPIIINDTKSIVMNPLLAQIAMALTKMNSIVNPNTNSTQNNADNKTIYSDLKSIAQNLPTNALWQIDNLQPILQQGNNFSAAFNSVNQTVIPEPLAIFFNKVTKKESYSFWNKNLSNSIRIFNINDQLPNPTNPQLDPNIQNLQLSAPILKSISDLLIGSNNTEINTSLVSIISQQIDRQAKKYSSLINSMSFFSPINPDFMTWNGDSSAAYNAFGVGTDEDLKLYISNQRASLEQFFNKNISPILISRATFFKDTFANNDRSIEYLINLQDSLSPTPKANTFGSFSSFLTTTMTNLRTESCAKFIAQPPVIGNSDYFSNKLRSIYSPLAKRCQTLLIKQAYSNYDKIASQFNSAIANKFPFQSNSKSMDSASIDDLNSLFTDFSQFQKQDLPILKQYSALYRGRPEIQNFIQSLTNAQNFFQIQSDKDGNLMPAKWNVDIDFRTNTDREILGNQIINWSLQSGNEIIGSDQGNISKGKFLWTYSDPMQFSVTLAQTSKYSLDKISEDKNIFITNNTIYFNVRNRWSLLKFINDYADCSNINYCLKNTLKFELPINNDKQVKFFITLYLKNAKGVRINVPNFPTLAPYIEKKGAKVSNVSDNFE